MSITVLDVTQGSNEWLDARRGMLTASVMRWLISTEAPDPITVRCPTCSAVELEPCLSVARKVPTPIKSVHPGRAAVSGDLPQIHKPATGDTANNLTTLLVAERITGWSDPVFVNADMERGQMDEPIARGLYGEHFTHADEVGLIVRSEAGLDIGYSPDGLVGSDGLIEIKSRRSKKHLATILADAVPDENMAQIQTGLLVTGRAWCDYLSYCGGMPLWRKRVYPDADWHAVIIEAARLFEHNAARMLTDYREAVKGLPMTERIDHYAVELKL